MKKRPPTHNRYGLSPHTTRKHAKEFIDYDYLHQLDDKALDWLNKFSEEYYHLKFREAPIHSQVPQKRALYNADNARRRDLWNTSKRWQTVLEPTPFTDGVDDE